MGHTWAGEQAGEMKKGYSTYKNSSATERDILRHIMFCQDFMYQRLDPRPLPAGRAVWILDLKGCSAPLLAP